MSLSHFVIQHPVIVQVREGALVRLSGGFRTRRAGSTGERNTGDRDPAERKINREITCRDAVTHDGRTRRCDRFCHGRGHSTQDGDTAQDGHTAKASDSTHAGGSRNTGSETINHGRADRGSAS
jgi:hypothetical protein